MVFHPQLMQGQWKPAESVDELRTIIPGEHHADGILALQDKVVSPLVQQQAHRCNAAIELLRAALCKEMTDSEAQ